MIEITQRPPKIHTAFNPTFVKFKGGAIGDMYHVSVSDINSSASASLQAEFIASEVVFDLEQITTSFFRDEHRMLTGLSDKLTEEFALFALYRYSWIVSATELYSDLSLAVNAVAQFGENQDLTGRCNKWLTGFRRLRRYNGFPLTASFLTPYDHGATSCYVSQDGVLVKNVSGNYAQSFTTGTPRHLTLYVRANTYISVANGDADPYLRDNTGRIIIDSTNQPILVDDMPSGFAEDTRMVDVVDVPEHPFYVRWINRFGGFDYWMMACKQIEGLSLSGVENYERPYEKTIDTKNNVFALSKTATNKIKVSTGSCDIDTLRELRWLPLSPIIDYYDVETGQWRGLLCNTSTAELGTAQSSGSLEFEFQLPTILLQF